MDVLHTQGIPAAHRLDATLPRATRPGELGRDTCAPRLAAAAHVPMPHRSSGQARAALALHRRVPGGACPTTPPRRTVLSGGPAQQFQQQHQRRSCALCPGTARPPQASPEAPPSVSPLPSPSPSPSAVALPPALPPTVLLPQQQHGRLPPPAHRLFSARLISALLAHLQLLISSYPSQQRFHNCHQSPLFFCNRLSILALFPLVLLCLVLLC